VAESLQRSDEVTKNIDVNNIYMDNVVAGRIASLIAIDPAEAKDLRDCVPEGFRIEHGHVFGPQGQVIALAGHGAGVDMAAVNRSTAHMDGAAL